VYQIGDHDGDAIQPFVPQVWTLLQSHCETQDEGTRAIVSECLGKLVQAGGEAVLSQLLSNLSASSSHTRATAVCVASHGAFTLTFLLMFIMGPRLSGASAARCAGRGLAGSSYCATHQTFLRHNQGSQHTFQVNSCTRIFCMMRAQE
jgi:hypothetical protein